MSEPSPAAVAGDRLPLALVARKPRPRPGERRTQILQALAAMLEQPGSERITTAALAARLEISEAALYRHFVSKAQMLEALNAGAIDIGQTGEAPPIFAARARPSTWSRKLPGVEPPAATTPTGEVSPPESPESPPCTQTRCAAAEQIFSVAASSAVLAPPAPGAAPVAAPTRSSTPPPPTTRCSSPSSGRASPARRSRRAS